MPFATIEARRQAAIAVAEAYGLKIPERLKHGAAATSDRPALELAEALNPDGAPPENIRARRQTLSREKVAMI
jgi:hypothetical protein